MLVLSLFGWDSGDFPLRGRAFDDAHDVAFLHDHQLFAVDLDLGAGPFAEQHAVADLDVEGHELAILVASAGARRNDLALHGLLLSGVGDDDPTRGLLVLLETAHDDAVMHGTELHESPPEIGFSWLGRCPS